MYSPKFTVFVVFVAVITVPGYSQLPSSDQSSWHSGPESYDLWSNFGTVFMEEQSTCWQSAGRLSLFYPVLNRTVCSGFSNGTQATAGQFTQDTLPDLVIASYNDQGNILLLENPGTEEIWSQTVIATGLMQCRSVACADIDNDGDQDVVYGCYSTGGPGWLENTGAKSEWPCHLAGTTTGITSVYCEDMDQDNDMDILFCSAGNDTLGWMNNLNGAGTNWSCETISTLNYPFYAVTSDINSDNIPDVVACFKQQNQVCWFERNTTDNSWTTHAVADIPQASCVSTGDVNQDSYTDILACGPDDNSVFLCTNENSSGTTWSIQNLQLNITGAKSCLLLDLDGDTDLDIVVASQSLDSVLILSRCNNGSNEYYNTSLVVDNPVFMCQIDSDGDSLPEIACLCTGEMHLLSANPTTFSSSGVLTSVVAFIPAGTDYVEWGDILWNSLEPEGTDIVFQVRASNDPDNMGEWSDTISTSGTFLGDILPENPYYIQYRVHLSSDSPLISPILFSVSLEGWHPGRVENSSSGVSNTSLFSVGSNPSRGSVSITLTPYTTGTREFSVFDLSGRAIAHNHLSPSASSCSEIIEGLAPGIYHLQVTAGDQTQTQKICVIN